MKLLADWQCHGPLLALWPYRNDVWRAGAWPAQQAILTLLRALAPYHPVRLGVHPPQLHNALARTVSDLELFPISYDDAWIRDIAPFWLAEPSGVTARIGQFTGWHGIHSVIQRDQQFARKLATQMRSRYRKLPLVIEGGMLSTDGAGTAVVHRKSLTQRNPELGWRAIEHSLKRALGLHSVIAIDHALSADETGGHVDNQLQFVDAKTLVCAASAQDSLWNEELTALQSQAWAAEYIWLELPPVQAIQDQRDRYFDVQRHSGALPRGDQPLLCSYANLLRLPKVIAVPQFGLATDADAVRILQKAFPQLAVVAVPALEFVRGGGGPHCLTHCLPQA